MGDEKKVAWILGAGFSKPLGGPLLNGLISSQMAGDFVNWPEFHEHPTIEGYDKIKCAEAVREIYERGCTETNATFWTNPEEFLERLDWACRESTNLWAFRIAKLVQQVPLVVQQLSTLHALNPMGVLPTANDLQQKFVNNVELLRREAIRFIAGACSYFTSNVRNVHQLEIWSPYFRWANKLRPDDVILTFNYDNVLDLMDPHLSQAKLRWAIPKNAAGDLGDSGNLSGTRVFHLHGHVGWERQDDGSVVRQEPMAFLDPEKAVLGMPGPSKKDLAEKQLNQVWRRAFHELGEADVVVFIGYRFPESDGIARQHILDALRENQKAQIYIVLGAGNPHTIRVNAMIEWTQRGGRPDTVVEQMGAEDFFSAFERERL